MDIQPVNFGYVLVVPNAHATHLSDLDEDTGGAVFQLGQRVAAALYRSEIRCEGINFFLADGEVAGQEVFHVHLHVLPRFESDGFGLKFGSNYGSMLDRRELDTAADQIREKL